MIDDRTANFNWPLPNKQNDPRNEDVGRLREAFQAIDAFAKSHGNVLDAIRSGAILARDHGVAPYALNHVDDGVAAQAAAINAGWRAARDADRAFILEPGVYYVDDEPIEAWRNAPLQASRPGLIVFRHRGTGWCLTVGDAEYRQSSDASGATSSAIFGGFMIVGNDQAQGGILATNGSADLFTAFVVYGYTKARSVSEPPSDDGGTGFLMAGNPATPPIGEPSVYTGYFYNLIEHAYIFACDVGLRIDGIFTQGQANTIKVDHCSIRLNRINILIGNSNHVMIAGGSLEGLPVGGTPTEYALYVRASARGIFADWPRIEGGYTKQPAFFEKGTGFNDFKAYQGAGYFSFQTEKVQANVPIISADGVSTLSHGLTGIDAAAIGARICLDGSADAAFNGRHIITAVPDATHIRFATPDGGGANVSARLSMFSIFDPADISNRARIRTINSMSSVEDMVQPRLIKPRPGGTLLPIRPEIGAPVELQNSGGDALLRFADGSIVLARQQTKAQLEALTPSEIGEIFYCSDLGLPVYADSLTPGRWLDFAGRNLGTTGYVVASVRATYAENEALTALVPFDDTVPEVTEGTEILAASITPQWATNKLRCRFSGQILSDTANVNAVAAVFAGEDCIGAGFVTLEATNKSRQVVIECEFLPGSIAEQTISVRVGPVIAASLYFNGATVGRMYGGAAAAVLTIEEIKA